MLVGVFDIPVEALDGLEAGGIAAVMKQPGFTSTQLHRGIAGSSMPLKDAVWQSVSLFGAAITNTEL